jgi:hypothetical protein
VSDLLLTLRDDLADAPLPLWIELHQKAVETHRSIDMQIVQATTSDLNAFKERKRACLSIS